MKITKPVLACALVAGLAGMSGVAASDQARPETRVQAGYYFAKATADQFNLSEDHEAALQAGSQAAGATVGAAAGAILGAKIGLAFGIFGAIAGAAIGAA